MQYTTNHSLPLYESTDVMNLTGGYNSAMRIIDSALNQAIVGAGKHIIFIGDSYISGYRPGGTIPVADRIVTLVSANLGITNVHNVSVSATGFVTGDTTFQQQAENAFSAAESGDYINDVAYIFVLGGRNDSTASANAASTLAQYLSNYFPNALIYYFGLWDSRRSCSAQQITNFAANAHAFSSVERGSGTWASIYWGIFRDDLYWDSTDIHPNAEGNHFIAENIITTIRGGDATQNGSKDINSKCSVAWHGANWELRWSGAPAAASGSQGVTLPGGMRSDTLAIGICNAGAQLGAYRIDVTNNGVDGVLNLVTRLTLTSTAIDASQNAFLRMSGVWGRIK